MADDHAPDNPTSQDVNTKSLPDDALPPVQAPDAGFLLQLFFIPLTIVGIIVMVWLLLYWLSHMGSNPKDLVQGLQKADNSAWQKASMLADTLSNPQNEHLKYDADLGAELAAALDKQIDEGPTKNENLIKLRMFICRAIGELKIDVGLPALIKAATTERDEAEIEPYNPKAQRKLTEIDVRRAALEAIAVLINNVGADKIRDADQLTDMLIATAGERSRVQRDEYVRAELRSAAAYVLGVIGGERALDKLEQVQFEDPNVNAQFNATVGLARNGDARATIGLLDMLDPANENVVKDELHESGKKFKRALVINNAIRAVRTLAEKNPSADLSKLQTAIESIEQSDLPSDLRVKAKELALELRKRRS